MISRPSPPLPCLTVDFNRWLTASWRTERR